MLEQPIVAQTPSAIPAIKNLERDVGGCFAPPQQNTASVTPTVQAVKDQTNNLGQLRDLNVISLSQANVKGDRLAPNPLIPINTLALASPGPAMPGTPVAAQPSQELRAWAAVVLSPVSHKGSETPVTAAGPVVFPSDFDAVQPSASLLTDILPFDFSSLDLSIRDFFSKIDQLGLKLSENHMDLLFSTGIMAVAASLALEMARRKIQTPVPALNLQRAGSIPYSDYP